MNFDSIEEARETLGLGQYATISEIKNAYRDIAVKTHPDRCPEANKAECEKMFKKISHARDLLVKYCEVYRYSFKEQDVKRSLMDGQLREYLKRYYDGWWGNLDL